MHDIVGDLTESQLLAVILPILDRGAAPDIALGPGDDSAVLRVPDGAVTVSTDVLVEGRHFRRDWSTGYDIGWRAVVQNLADAAAMGARPVALVVALVLPPATTLAWLRDFARGAAAACDRYGARVVGGDLSSGDLLVAAVTVLGDSEGRPAVTRTGARAGDVVAVAGRLGWSAAGLVVCGRVRPDQLATGNIPLQVRVVVDSFLRPEPAIAEGVAAHGATAMLDVSDGLVLDTRRLAQASGVAVELSDPLLTCAHDASVLREVAAWLGIAEAEQDALVREWILSGGEDHGMVATFPAGQVPAGFRPMGAAISGPRGSVLVDGHLWGGRGGWQHFAS